MSKDCLRFIFSIEVQGHCYFYETWYLCTGKPTPKWIKSGYFSIYLRQINPIPCLLFFTSNVQVWKSNLHNRPQTPSHLHWSFSFEKGGHKFWELACWDFNLPHFCSFDCLDGVWLRCWPWKWLCGFDPWLSQLPRTLTGHCTCIRP